jgi:hypothetical protein
MRDVPPRGRRRASGELAYAMVTSSCAGFAVPSHAIAKPEFIAGGRLSALVFSAALVLETCVPGGNVAATTIAVKRAKDFVVVAADSRVTGEDGRPRWRDKCKIMLLDDEGFFASVGVVSARGGGGAGEIRFSADQVARHQYGASSDLRRVADGWAEAMEARFNAQQFSWKRSIVNTLRRFQVEDRLFAQGIFASSRATVAAWEAQVNYDETPSTITFSHAATREIVADEAGINLWGTNAGRAVVTELLQGGTEKSALWRASVTRESDQRGFQSVDRHAFEMKRALDYAIATGVDPAIGGDVATLIVERDKPARWFSKPSVCND